MSKTILSFTTLNTIHKYPCYWINKLMGIEQEANEFMIAGKKAHEKFAEKIKNKEKLPFDLKFRTAEVHFRKEYGKYLLHGYADGANYETKTLLELKTVSKKLWTNSDVEKSMQPVYYSWISGFPNVSIITSKFDLSEAKLYQRSFTDTDWKKAEQWALQGIDIVENTDWKKIECAGNCYLGSDCFIFQRNNS